MSTILDALRKSERERTQVRGVGFGDASRYWVPHPDRSWQWMTVAAVIASVAVVALVIVYGWSRSNARVSADVVASAPVVATPAAVETPAVVTAAPPTPVPIVPAARGGSAPFLASLPSAFQQSLPPLQVTIHVFAPDEADRMLYINNQAYRRGDQVADGVVVEEIVPDGVVLSTRTQRFKLPRPQ